MYDLCVSEIPDNLPPESETRHERESKSRWESLIWPRWLPTRARLPLIAQMLGAAALVAAMTMPNWVEPPPATAAAPLPPPPASEVVVAPEPPREPVRPAHLNLDVRHTFASVDLSVSVDGERALDTKVAGAKKRFGVLGKRSERSFTKTLDLDPGTRVVRIRVRTSDDKFDQTRVERFDLGSASVASLRVSADKSGLSVIADRPPAPSEPARAARVREREAEAAPQIRPASTAVTAPVPAANAGHGPLAELYRTFRQVLMALAGFIASVASGFFVEEYLKARVGAISRRTLRG